MDVNTRVLKSDRYYNRLSEEDIVTIIERAPKMASILASDYPLKLMKQILDSEGFTIVETCNAEQSAVRYRARIHIGKDKQIFVYTDSVDEMVAKFPQVSKEQAKQMFIAHEFVHYLEFKKEIDTSYYIKQKLLMIERKLEVHAFSEIVANEYARLVTGSLINPMEIDKEKYEV